MPEIGTLKQVKQGSVHIAGVLSDDVHVIREKQNIIIHKDAVPPGGRQTNQQLFRMLAMILQTKKYGKP